ncbi:MAG: phage integrase SAM-like domain-containing protein [bacterium]
MITKVTLRKKPISKGRESLYLDFYPAIIHPESGKKTRREFLKLYILKKPKTPIEKESNKQTLWIADQIRQKRENQLNKPEVYDEFEREKLKLKEIGKQSFTAYFKSLMDKRKGTNYQSWLSAYKHLNNFNDNIIFADITEKLCKDFKEHLINEGSISQNTAAAYFNKFKAVLREAFNDGYLQTDINAKIPSIKEEETYREFLTENELNKLIETPCNNDTLKRAALFSALTGLRHVDIKNLTWKQHEYFEGHGHFIRFRQQKTGQPERHPISDDAYKLMGAPKEPEKKVFEGFEYSAYQNKHLHQWIGAAGITKKITFHCFRHTYAVLQLAAGTDIYTVSKMMGHKDLKTTQIYAKIVDENKIKAANKIKLNL